MCVKGLKTEGNEIIGCGDWVLVMDGAGNRAIAVLCEEKASWATLVLKRLREGFRGLTKTIKKGGLDGPPHKGKH